jgi:hypothetical protein
MVGIRRGDDKLLERYVWAAVVIFISVIAACTILIATNHGAELQRFAILIAQGVGFVINFWLVFRSNKNTEIRVRNTVEDGVRDAVQTGIDSAVKKVAESNDTTK